MWATVTGHGKTAEGHQPRLLPASHSQDGNASKATADITVTQIFLAASSRCSTRPVHVTERSRAAPSVGSDAAQRDCGDCPSIAIALSGGLGPVGSFETPSMSRSNPRTFLGRLLQ